MDYLYLILGFVFLFVGGEMLVRSSVSLALKYNVSKLVVGVTVVSFATSAPELLVSLESTFSGFPDIAIGNVIGSNIANIGLVLALTCIVEPIFVDKNTLRYNYPVMILSSLVLFFTLFIFGGLNILSGIFYFSALLFFLIFIIKKSKNVEQNDDFDVESYSLIKSICLFLLGSLALYFGADFFIEGAVNIASSLGVSERIISLSLVAIGTSIPELAASLVAAFKKQNGIALGNLIGSNIFNILAVLGLTSIFIDVSVVDRDLVDKDIIWMLGFAIIIFPLLKMGKKNMLGKKEGFIILLFFLAYLYFL